DHVVLGKVETAMIWLVLGVEDLFKAGNSLVQMAILGVDQAGEPRDCPPGRRRIGLGSPVESRDGVIEPALLICDSGQIQIGGSFGGFVVERQELLDRISGLTELTPFRTDSALQ